MRQSASVGAGPRHRRASWSMLLFNVVGNQLVWLIAVDRAAAGHAWPGVAAAILFVLLSLHVSPAPRVEVKLVATAVALGMCVDGVASAQGWVTYAAPLANGHLVPLWILALWASLAVSLNVSLRSVQHRLWLAVLLGGIGGPLAYLAAEAGWGAVRFEAPRAMGLAWLAGAWALLLPALLVAAQRLQAAHHRQAHVGATAPSAESPG